MSAAEPDVADTNVLGLTSDASRFVATAEAFRFASVADATRLDSDIRYQPIYVGT